MVARRPRRVAPVFQLLIYPVCDSPAVAVHAHFAAGFFLTRAEMAWFRGHYLADDAPRPTRGCHRCWARTSTGLRARVVATAGFDPLRDEGEAYARAPARGRRADDPAPLRGATATASRACWGWASGSSAQRARRPQGCAGAWPSVRNAHQGSSLSLPHEAAVGACPYGSPPTKDTWPARSVPWSRTASTTCSIAAMLASRSSEMTLIGRVHRDLQARQAPLWLVVPGLLPSRQPLPPRRSHAAARSVARHGPLDSGYAQAFNRRHDRVGHLFQGRFGSRLVQEDDHLLTTLRYVALNPVESSLCSAPENWRWSGHSEILGLASARVVDVAETLKLIADDAGAAFPAYRALFGDDRPAPMPSGVADVVLGEAEFVVPQSQRRRARVRSPEASATRRAARPQRGLPWMRPRQRASHRLLRPRLRTARDRRAPRLPLLDGQPVASLSRGANGDVAKKDLTPIPATPSALGPAAAGPPAATAAAAPGLASSTATPVAGHRCGASDGDGDGAASTASAWTAASASYPSCSLVVVFCLIGRRRLLLVGRRLLLVGLPGPVLRRRGVRPRRSAEERRALRPAHRRAEQQLGQGQRADGDHERRARSGEHDLPVDAAEAGARRALGPIHLVAGHRHRGLARRRQLARRALGRRAGARAVGERHRSRERSRRAGVAVRAVRAARRMVVAGRLSTSLTTATITGVIAALINVPRCQK